MAIVVDNKNIIFGRNPVKEAFKANRIKSIYMTNNFSHAEILSYIEKTGVKTTIVSVKELDNLCQGAHQGIAAECKPYEYTSLDKIVNSPCKIPGKSPVVLILDGIEDPHNLGAILRSADIFGVSGVIISKHNQVQLNSTVAKTSAGAINYVPVALVNNLHSAIEYLKENKFWVVATDGSGTQDYDKIKYDFPVALIIGSEGYGVSKLLLKSSDYIVKIPMYGQVNSLNASVAAGIFLSRIRSF